MANAQAVERILSQATTVTLADLVMTFASTFPGQDTFTAACHLYMFYKEEEQSTPSEIVSVMPCDYTDAGFSSLFHLYCVFRLNTIDSSASYSHTIRIMQSVWS
jgi:hypothetical protein